MSVDGKHEPCLKQEDDEISWPLILGNKTVQFLANLCWHTRGVFDEFLLQKKVCKLIRTPKIVTSERHSEDTPCCWVRIKREPCESAMQAGSKPVGEPCKPEIPNPNVKANQNGLTSNFEPINVVVPFESVDETPVRDHSNESYWAVFSSGAVCFWQFRKMTFQISPLSFEVSTLASERVN